MRIEEFRGCLERRARTSGLRFQLSPPATEDALEQVARVIGAPLPSQVLLFYRAYNGMLVEEPNLRVLPVEELKLASAGRVPFAMVGDGHWLAFEVGARNVADQWDIVSMDTRAVVTLTMASFWSNKVFAWLDNRRAIWST
ncbi:SMI1/KNR4 family protein [Myxococcaceae bacterium GXIMD 01537]